MTPGDPPRAIIATDALCTAEIQRSRIVGSLRSARRAYSFVMLRPNDAVIESLFNALADCGEFNRRHPDLAITQYEVLVDTA